MILKPTTQVNFLLFLSAVVYVGLGYFTDRPDFFQLLLLFSLAFGAYALLLRQNLSLRTGIGAAFVFRLLLLFSYPTLSDDYFRFIWDGSLLASGHNPFLHLPLQIFSEIQTVSGLDANLYQHLNSKQYYTVYPPVCQFIFAFSVWITSGSTWGAIIVMRVFLLTADLGSFYLMEKLLQRYRQPANLMFWYALNPLVIIELTGNLHFEGLMIFFTLGSMYLLNRQKIILAAVLFAMAIAVKMLPLLFVPFLLFKLCWNKIIRFGACTLFVLGLLFYPFISEALFYNIGQSLDLYFQKFEFNASIYYLLRWLGYQFYGYNNIARFGPFLSVLTFTAIMGMAYKSRKAPEDYLPTLFLAALTIYFFLATTVHPWYLTTLVAFSVFTPYRYAIIWTWAAILSYATYITQAYQENLLLTALEYGLVWGWLFLELIKVQHHNNAAPLPEIKL